jgi:hypothetical protein
MRIGALPVYLSRSQLGPRACPEEKSFATPYCGSKRQPTAKPGQRIHLSIHGIRQMVSLRFAHKQFLGFLLPPSVLSWQIRRFKKYNILGGFWVQARSIPVLSG